MDGSSKKIELSTNPYVTPLTQKDVCKIHHDGSDLSRLWCSPFPPSLNLFPVSGSISVTVNQIRLPLFHYYLLSFPVGNTALGRDCMDSASPVACDPVTLQRGTAHISMASDLGKYAFCFGILEEIDQLKGINER